MMWSIIGWIGLGLISLVVILFIISNLRLRLVQRKQTKGLNKIFAEHNLNAPTLTFDSSYWWPTFTLEFPSQTEYLTAKEKGTFKEFEKMIAEFYDEEFNPKMAIRYTYPEQTS